MYLVGIGPRTWPIQNKRWNDPLSKQVKSENKYFFGKTYKIFFYKYGRVTYFKESPPQANFSEFPPQSLRFLGIHPPWEFSIFRKFPPPKVSGNSENKIFSNPEFSDIWEFRPRKKSRIWSLSMLPLVALKSSQNI